MWKKTQTGGLASAGGQRMRNGGKPGAVHADSLDEQRNRYAWVAQAWDSKQMDTVQALMPTLKDYPLYLSGVSPDYWRSHGINPTVTVNNFIQANPARRPPEPAVSFVNELARREDWRGLAFSLGKNPNTTEAQCNCYYAKWATGQQEEAGPGAKSCNRKSQPNACDSLFGAGVLPVNRIRWLVGVSVWR